MRALGMVRRRPDLCAVGSVELRVLFTFNHRTRPLATREKHPHHAVLCVDQRHVYRERPRNFICFWLARSVVFSVGRRARFGVGARGVAMHLVAASSTSSVIIVVVDALAELRG